MFVALSTICLILSFGFVLSARMNHEKNHGAFAALCIVAAVAFFLFAAVRVIPPGPIGIQVFFGKVKGEPLSEGMHIINPLLSVTPMSIRTQEYTMVARAAEGNVQGDDSIPLFTKDTMRLNADVTVIFRTEPSLAPWLYQTMGSEEEFINKVIRPASRAAFRKAARKYTMIELMGEMRDVLEDDIQKYVKTYVDEIARNSLGLKGGEPFIIQEVMVRNIEPPASFKAAVEAKLIAEQEAQKMRFVLQKEQQEAERKKIEAQGIATFQRIVRQGIDEQLLRWKGIEATQELAESQNTKIVVIGGKNGLPLILNEGEAVKK